MSGLLDEKKIKVHYALIGAQLLFQILLWGIDWLNFGFQYTYMSLRLICQTMVYATQLIMFVVSLSVMLNDANPLLTKNESFRTQ